MPAPKASRGKGFSLFVLIGILGFTNVDRIALGLLLQDIKLDLRLSDTQLGLLTGFAFFVFYSLVGIPIARWSDRGNRATIIALSAIIAGAAVALCGLAAGFLTLVFIRIWAAIGEAGTVPPSHSLIADSFTRAERPRAVAAYKLGIPLSLIIGYFIAGWLNALYGWRFVFVALGLPAMAFGFFAFTLHEPRTAARPGPGGSASVARRQAGLRSTFSELWRIKSYRNLLFAYSVIAFFGTGIGQWKPTFFIRSFGLGTAELGTWFAAIAGGCGLFGTFFGGRLATRFAANNERRQLGFIALIYAICGVLAMLTYLTTNVVVAFVLVGAGFVGLGIVIGPLFSIMQLVVPERIRAMSIAILLMFANLIGSGLGPLAAGVLSDGFRGWAGAESLRFALLTLCPGYVWCAWHIWKARATIATDIERAGEAGR